MAQEKVETLSTFEKRKNSLTNHITKILLHDTNKHDIIQRTHANGNNMEIGLKKYSGVPLKQNSLSKSNIIFRETPGLYHLHLKRKKTQDDSWFYYKQVSEMLLLTLLEAVVYQGQHDKGELLPWHRYKETRIFLINTVALF